MQPIPTPQLLDPDRILANDRGGFTTTDESRTELLADALKKTCDYAQQLWHDLDGLRQYLLDSLPSDPRAPGPHPSASASPTGPDDEEGWERWVTAFATVSSALTGPQGDSGYGLKEARRLARDRRTAPLLTLTAHHPGLTAPESPAHSQESPAPRAADPAGSARPGALARGIGTGILVLLALRGLRPRRWPPS